MGNLNINTIDRNIGAFTQSYRIEYKKTLDGSFIQGPVLSYNGAQPAPAGQLPVIIPLPSPSWDAETEIEVRIVTLCPPTEEVNGDVTVIPIHGDPC